MSKLSQSPAILFGFLLLALMSATVSATALPEFTALFETYGPAVVNISTKQSQSGGAGPHGFSVPDLPEDSPLYDFFRRFFGENGEVPEDEIQSRSLGSGFIVTADGYVMTNAHVVESADEIIVRTNDRQEFVATVVGSDKRSDIALIKVEAQGLPVVKIGSAKDLKVGDIVLFDKYTGSKVNVSDQEQLIVKEEDILAVVEG